MLVHEQPIWAEQSFSVCFQNAESIKKSHKAHQKPNELYTKYEFYFSSSVDFIKNIILSNSWVFISFVSWIFHLWFDDDCVLRVNENENDDDDILLETICGWNIISEIYVKL